MKYLLTILVLLVWVTEGNLLAQTASVVVTPSSQQISQDSSALVRIRVNNIEGMHAYNVQLSYDPLIVRCRSVRRLGFLGTTTFFSILIDSLNGRTVVNEAILGPGSQSGTGDLVELRFFGLSNGSATLSFTTVDCRDTLNQTITVTSQGGVIQVGPPTAVGETAGMSPVGFRIGNYPNPFNSSTTIRYTTGEGGETDIRIYSVLGSEVYHKVCVDDPHSTREFVWKGQDMNGVDVSSGTYIVRIYRAKTFLSTNVLMLK